MFEFPKAKTRKQHLSEYKRRLASNAKYERAMFNSLRQQRENIGLRKTSVEHKPLAHY